MHDPVAGGRAQQLVVEGVVPFRGVQIAGDDRRSPLVAISDDVMEVLVLSGQRHSKTDPPSLFLYMHDRNLLTDDSGLALVLESVTVP